MKQKQVISYVYDFLSLLFEKEDVEDINNIILFGSVAKNEFDKESDIDIFVDVSKNEKEMEKKVSSALNSFYTKVENTWALKGINIPIKLIVGNLKEEKWRELKDEIISDGVSLYGEFKELSKKIEHYYLFKYSMKRFKRKDKMKFLRRLYGYKCEKKKKIYEQEGLLKQVEGERIGTYSILVPKKYIKNVKEFFKMFKMNYIIKEVWL